MRIVPVATLLAAASASASVLITVQGGFFYQSDGTTLVPEGSIGALVVDTTGNGFSSITDLGGLSATEGGLWGDDYVLGIFSANSDGTFNDSFPGVVYSGELTENDAMAFYWFPELTSVGGTLAASMSWGFYRTDVVDPNSGADMAFRMPVDGFDYTLAFFENSLAPGALATPADFTAMPGMAAVPEPANLTLMAGLAGLGLAWHRRRRRGRIANAG